MDRTLTVMLDMLRPLNLNCSYAFLELLGQDVLVTLYRVHTESSKKKQLTEITAISVKSDEHFCYHPVEDNTETVFAVEISHLDSYYAEVSCSSDVRIVMNQESR